MATFFVAVGALVYALWLAGVGSEGATGVRVATGIVLALGFGASASAVVPGFNALLRGSKLYLVVTSLLGVGALVAGIFALLSGREVVLGLLVATTVVLWAISTLRHTLAAGITQGTASGSTRRGTPLPG